MFNLSKPNVTVNLGPKVYKYEKTVEELNDKIKKLSDDLNDSLKENLTLKQEITDLKSTNKDKEYLILKLEKELNNVKSNIEDLNRTLDFHNNSTVQNHSSNLENLKTIKFLKLEIDELTYNLNYYKDNKEKIEKEILECDKIKSVLEKNNISLLEENKKLTGKLDTANNILKQKEKYIEILMKEKNKNFKKTDPDDIKQVEKKTIKTSSNKEINSINNNLILQNKLCDYEKLLDEKEKIIKALEFEKMNLLNRIRNKKD